MGNGENLRRAKAAKNDEFYTRLEDVEAELGHYSRQFRGKTVLCNCDDPMASSFTKYFCLKFHDLGLKRLICTCYRSRKIDLFSQGNDAHGTYFSYDGGHDVDHIPDKSEVELRYLDGDGDFRSDECLDILRQADIVVTNPPFSEFREYVRQLVDMNKKFLIIGNKNAITYKEIFPLIKENRLWLGYNNPKAFVVPNDSVVDRDNVIVENGKRVAKFGNIGWFTNLDVVKRHEDIVLFRRYWKDDGTADEDAYPTYDNYGAINVDRVCDIPCDYDGVMGVPITFLDKYNPEQFEIIDPNGIRKNILEKDSLLIKDADAKIRGGRITYARICIKSRRRRMGSDGKEKVCTSVH